MNPKEVVDFFFRKGIPFVLYRKPQEELVTLIVDEDAQSVYLDEFCFEKQGFVFFPFDAKGVKGVYFKKDKKYRLGIDELGLDNFSEMKNENSVYKPNITDKVDYTYSVEKAIESISEDDFKKVVVSKVKKEEVDNIGGLSEELFSSYSNAFVYVAYTHQFGLWLGATPETLLSQDGELIKTVALAGTQSAIGKDEKEAQWTQKEIEEQALVSRYIINCFKKIRLREFEDVGPKTVKAGELFHLKTDFFINEKELGYTDLFGQLVRLLHPTSAVCGMPLMEASEFINKQENYKRELFTGICGPINIDDKSHLFVNLRSAKIVENEIYSFAGAGITIDSDPIKEWEETELKCETILSILNK